MIKTSERNVHRWDAPKSTKGNESVAICTLCNQQRTRGTSIIFRKIAVRSAEHVAKLKKESPQSPLWKHIIEHHPHKGHQVKFELIVTGTFFDSLSRQADEAQRIQNRKR